MLCVVVLDALFERGREQMTAHDDVGEEREKKIKTVAKSDWKNRP